MRKFILVLMLSSLFSCKKQGSSDKDSSSIFSLFSGNKRNVPRMVFDFALEGFPKIEVGKCPEFSGTSFLPTAPKEQPNGLTFWECKAEDKGKKISISLGVFTGSTVPTNILISASDDSLSDCRDDLQITPEESAKFHQIQSDFHNQGIGSPGRFGRQLGPYDLGFVCYNKEASKTEDRRSVMLVMRLNHFLDPIEKSKYPNLYRWMTQVGSRNAQTFRGSGITVQNTGPEKFSGFYAVEELLRNLKKVPDALMSFGDCSEGDIDGCWNNQHAQKFIDDGMAALSDLRAALNEQKSQPNLDPLTVEYLGALSELVKRISTDKQTLQKHLTKLRTHKD